MADQDQRNPQKVGIACDLRPCGRLHGADVGGSGEPVRKRAPGSPRGKPCRSKETSTSNAAFLARRPIGASPGMQDPGRRSVARISRQKAQQGPSTQNWQHCERQSFAWSAPFLLGRRRTYMTLETLGSELNHPIGTRPHFAQRAMAGMFGPGTPVADCGIVHTSL
jgi:hypothetical protein